ncbi:uncharacterized protein LOC132732776 [Ruditapes philippinarum]|uniref:uncharacterized protein LOC132732776 n=1 Tax=Ruditapes philippinarum TaxID=129788 RepID=UPI00295B0FCB|nr:uncharacterized protein LOC132732776 [Ruditapes philippinarum]
MEQYKSIDDELDSNKDLECTSKQLIKNVKKSLSLITIGILVVILINTWSSNEVGTKPTSDIIVQQLIIAAYFWTECFLLLITGFLLFWCCPTPWFAAMIFPYYGLMMCFISGAVFILDSLKTNTILFLLSSNFYTVGIFGQGMVILFLAHRKDVIIETSSKRLSAKQLLL